MPCVDLLLWEEDERVGRQDENVLVALEMFIYRRRSVVDGASMCS